jgi:hypothetical protein
LRGGTQIRIWLWRHRARISIVLDDRPQGGSQTRKRGGAEATPPPPPRGSRARKQGGAEPASPPRTPEKGPQARERKGAVPAPPPGIPQGGSQTRKRGGAEPAPPPRTPPRGSRARKRGPESEKRRRANVQQCVSDFPALLSERLWDCSRSSCWGQNQKTGAACFSKPIDFQDFAYSVSTIRQHDRFPGLLFCFRDFCLSPGRFQLYWAGQAGKY